MHLLPFLDQCSEHPQSHVLRPKEVHAEMLYNLGSSASACQTARPATWPVLESYVNGHTLTMAQHTTLRVHNPAMFRFVQGVGAPDVAVKRLLRAVVCVAKVAYAPQTLQVPPPHPAAAATGRIEVVQAPADRHPAVWSREEAFLRTGTWSGLSGNAGWSPSALGGSDVLRPVGRYAADQALDRQQNLCTKHPDTHPSLLPGCLMMHCVHCRVCVYFGLMVVQESPRSVFEVLKTRRAEAPRMIIYDNCCNLMHFALNRDPEFFRDTEFFVDQFHFAGHSHCHTDFTTRDVKERLDSNSSLAEQFNSIFRSLEHAAGYMNQDTFLLYARHFIHRMNKLQRQKRAGKCFFYAKASRRRLG
jgi:hypothetical protein